MKRLLVAALALTLLASGCAAGGGGTGGGETPAAGGEPVIDGVLTMALDSDPGSLNPFLSTSNNVREITPFAYDSLVFLDPETGEAHPWLAESWEESPTELTFTLRDGVTCSDGTPFTAETAANNINWVADPANASALLGVLVPADVTASFDNEARTVTVAADSPNSFFLTQIGALEMICQAGLDDPESLTTATNGTGMYMLTEAVPNDHYTLERRDDYAWGPEGGNSPDTPGVPKTVIFQVVDNVSTRSNLLLNGQVNLAPVSGPDEDRVAAQSQVIRSQPFIVGQFYFSQFEGQPTAEEDVRIAIVHALDLDALTNVMTSGRGYRAERLAMMTPNPCQYDAATPNLPAYDPELAASMLDAAGWTMGPDGIRERDGEPLSLRFIYSESSETTAPTMELVKQQLAAVGVDVVLDGSDTSAHLDRLYSGNFTGEFDAANQNVNINIPSILAPWNSGPVPPNGRNATNVQNEEYDRLRAEALAIAGADSCDTWEASEAALFAAADSVPFAARDNIVYGNGVATTLPNVISGASVTLVE